MNQDMIWMFVRSLLMIGSTYLTTRGLITEEQGAALIGAAGIIFTLGWQAWVRWNTKAVSAETAARPDVPTLSAATGKVEDGQH